MARPKSPFAVYAEYLPLRGLFWLLGALPFGLSQAIAGALLRAALFLMPDRRRILNSNLDLAFPEKSRQERRAIARGSIDNLARGVAMFARIPGAAKASFKDVVEVEGSKHLEAALRRGRGILLFTAHVGCWEMMGAYVPTLFSQGAMVVRPIDNPKLDQLVARVRASGGGIVIPHRRLFKESLRVLRANGTVGVLIDQNFAHGGAFVNFFGHLAATTPVVSLLARRTGAALIPMHNVWERGKIRIIFGPPVALSTQADPAKAVVEDTQRMTAEVERWVRERPDHWLWLHNRWKRQPQPSDPGFTPPAA
jgi:KDO2-lipid IV(A) lauroyltransferase